MAEAKQASQWPPAWSRAALGTAVLASLEHGPLHGYGIALAVCALGLGRPKGGSLYPLLTALEESGAVVTRWEEGSSGPGKRNYELTSVGKDRLREERQAWSALVAALHSQRAHHETVNAAPGAKP